MRLILAALISLSFSVGAQTSLESDYEAQRRLLAEAAEKARMTKLIEKFNSIAKTYSQPTIDQVESRSEKGVVPGYESQFADGYS